MAYNFLGLVNDINRRVNEVQLTATNFSAATGFYDLGKDAVNSAIRYINQSEYEWPFNHVTQEDVLTVNTARYPFPDDAKTINFRTFRIREDSTLNNSTVKLRELAYNEYLERYVDQEYKDNPTQGVPRHTTYAPSLEYIVEPVPDKAYTLVYEYYRIAVELLNATDVPNVPERFRHIIIDGAMHYAYLFRGNSQDAIIAKEKFDEGIKHMRSLLINNYTYVRSSMIPTVAGGRGRAGASLVTAGSSLDSL